MRKKLLHRIDIIEYITVILMIILTESARLSVEEGSSALAFHMFSAMLIFFLHPIVWWIMKEILPIKFYQGNTLLDCFFSIEVMICVTAISYEAIQLRDFIKRKG